MHHVKFRYNISADENKLFGKTTLFSAGTGCEGDLATRWIADKSCTSFIFSVPIQIKIIKIIMGCNTYCCNNGREMHNWELDVFQCYTEQSVCDASLLPSSFQRLQRQATSKVWCHKPLTFCFTAHTRHVFARGKMACWKWTPSTY